MAPASIQPVEPVEPINTGSERPLEEGMALCLSGSGYRAILFLAVTLWRLNHLGKGG